VARRWLATSIAHSVRSGAFAQLNVGSTDDSVGTDAFSPVSITQVSTSPL